MIVKVLVPENWITGWVKQVNYVLKRKKKRIEMRKKKVVLVRGAEMFKFSPTVSTTSLLIWKFWYTGTFRCPVNVSVKRLHILVSIFIQLLLCFDSLYEWREEEESDRMMRRDWRERKRKVGKNHWEEMNGLVYTLHGLLFFSALPSFRSKWTHSIDIYM